MVWPLVSQKSYWYTGDFWWPVVWWLQNLLSSGWKLSDLSIQSCMCLGFQFVDTYCSHRCPFLGSCKADILVVLKMWCSSLWWLSSDQTSLLCAVGSLIFGSDPEGQLHLLQIFCSPSFVWGWGIGQTLLKRASGVSIHCPFFYAIIARLSLSD